MTGGEALVSSLIAHDVHTVSGIPGTHSLAVYDALVDAPQIRHILTRHEQGAAFMADGYARASGEVGVCLSTTGPAVRNTLAPLGTAYGDSSPVLVLASQIPSRLVGQERGFLHECRDQLACLATVTKWCSRVDTVNAVPWAVREAFAQIRRGRPRPAAIEVPCDVLDATDETSVPPPASHEIEAPNAHTLSRAARMLKTAKRPVLWAGGGVITSGACNALRKMAEALQAPVFSTTLGKSSITSDHPLAVGRTVLHPAARKYVESCDLLLAVGTRFTELETERWSLRLPKRLVHIDVDPSEIGRNCPVDVAVVGDARVALEAILEQLDDTPRPGDRMADVARLRHQVWSESHRRSPEAVKLVRTLRAALPRETIVVNDLTIAAF